MAAQHRHGFVGRSSERETLRCAVDHVRGGQSAVLVIRGEAGIGKTALLAEARDVATGFRVVEIAGVESEMELPFAGLHQLCGSMLGRLGTLPPPQRSALSVAFGLEPEEGAVVGKWGGLDLGQRRLHKLGLLLKGGGG